MNLLQDTKMNKLDFGLMFHFIGTPYQYSTYNQPICITLSDMLDLEQHDVNTNDPQTNTMQIESISGPYCPDSYNTHVDDDQDFPINDSYEQQMKQMAMNTTRCKNLNVIFNENESMPSSQRKSILDTLKHANTDLFVSDISITFADNKFPFPVAISMSGVKLHPFISQQTEVSRFGAIIQNGFDRECDILLTCPNIYHSEQFIREYALINSESDLRNNVKHKIITINSDDIAVDFSYLSLNSDNNSNVKNNTHTDYVFIYKNQQPLNNDLLFEKIQKLPKDYHLEHSFNNASQLLDQKQDDGFFIEKNVFDSFISYEWNTIISKSKPLTKLSDLKLFIHDIERNIDNSPLWSSECTDLRFDSNQYSIRFLVNFVLYTSTPSSSQINTN